MEYRKIDGVYFLRLDRGEEVLTSLAKFCKKESVFLASVEGIGAVNRATIGIYSVETHEYTKKTLEGPMEILSLLGNVTQKDGETYLHLHIVLADEELKAIGGHLNEAIIAATGEIVIRPINGRVYRQYDEEIGLNLFHFTPTYEQKV